MVNLSPGPHTRLRESLAVSSVSVYPNRMTSWPPCSGDAFTLNVARVVGRSVSGLPVTLASVQYRVSYADLELSIPSNARVLKTRVRDAARDACADLNKLYPITASGSNECSAKAEERAMPQVLSAIAAAESRKLAAD